MEYVYGTANRGGVMVENLKTVGSSHTALSGFSGTVRVFEDGTKIEDRCRIIEKYASKEANGVCYDWYTITDHYQQTDTSKKAQEKLDQLTANLDYISMMSGVDIPTEGGV